MSAQHTILVKNSGSKMVEKNIGLVTGPHCNSNFETLRNSTS